MIIYAAHCVCSWQYWVVGVKKKSVILIGWWICCWFVGFVRCWTHSIDIRINGMQELADVSLDFSWQAWGCSSQCDAHLCEIRFQGKSTDYDIIAAIFCKLEEDFVLLFGIILFSYTWCFCVSVGGKSLPVFGPQLPPASFGYPPGKCPSLGDWWCSGPLQIQGRSASGWPQRPGLRRAW